jgi:hypothetical protein
VAYTWYQATTWRSHNGQAQCDAVTMSWQNHNSSNQAVGASGSVLLYTYPDGETTATHSWADQYAHVFTATATSTHAGRSFDGRYFFEEDGTPAGGSDNCWFGGTDPSWKYVILNGNGGDPHSGNWWTASPLDSDSQWPFGDKVGWNYNFGPTELVTYYRKNSAALATNGSCSATVGQWVYLVSYWPSLNDWYARSYKYNSHVIGIHSKAIANYAAARSGASDNWNVEATRDGVPAAKMWPILDAPTNLAIASISNSGVDLSFSSPGGDAHGSNVYRRPPGGAYTLVGISAGVDSSVASNEYYYCVKARHARNDDTTNLLWEGPCSSEVHFLIAGTGTHDGKNNAFIVYSPACCTYQTGWWLDNTYYANATAGTQDYSRDTGATATFQFYGSSLTWVHLLYPHMGKANVTIDGVDKGDYDLYSPSQLWAQGTPFSLGSGIHTAVITVLGQRNGASSDYFVDVDALVVN